METITRHLKFYNCSMCDTVSTERSRLTAHITRNKTCAGATVEESLADVMFQKRSTTTSPSPEKDTTLKLEKKVLDRVASGLVDLESIDTSGIDERTDYLFENRELLHTIFNVLDKKPVRTHPVIHMASKMFEHLWGCQAPPRFQSVFMYKRVIHVINSIEDPDDPMTVDILQYKTKEEVDAMIVNVWMAQRDMAEMVCARYPHERFGEAAQMYFNLTGGGNARLTVIDVLERNPTYHKYRKTYPEVVKLANAFRKEFRELVKKVNLRSN